MVASDVDGEAILEATSMKLPAVCSDLLQSASLDANGVTVTYVAVDTFANMPWQASQLASAHEKVTARLSLGSNRARGSLSQPPDSSLT